MGPNVSNNESNLIVKLKTGDKSAFEEIFNLYKAKLYFFSLSYLHSKTEAEDVVQKVFIGLWEHREKLNESLPVKGYLYKATINHIYNYFKHQSIRRKHMEQTIIHQIDGDDSAQKTIDYNELTKSIDNLIARLPQKQQEIFKLSRWEGLSHHQISQQLGLSVRSVENHIYRILKYIKENIKEEHQF